MLLYSYNVPCAKQLMQWEAVVPLWIIGVRRARNVQLMPALERARAGTCTSIKVRGTLSYIT